MTSASIASKVKGSNPPPIPVKPRWVIGMIRVGYGARGVFYVLLAWLAGRGAIDWARSAGGAPKAMDVVRRWPGGGIIVVVLGVGFLGMSAGMIVSAWNDWEGTGSFWKRQGRRVARFFSAIGHLVLASIAMLLALGFGPNKAREQSWAARGLRLPLGRVGFAAVAAIAIIYGIVQFWKAVRYDPSKQLTINSRGMDWLIDLIGRVGIASRGVVYVTLGALLGAAAWWIDAHDATGIGGALDAMRNKPPLGTWILAIVACGLGAYGALMFAYAAYARLGPNDPPKV